MIKLRCRTNQIRSNRYCRVLIAAPACCPSQPYHASRAPRTSPRSPRAARPIEPPSTPWVHAIARYKLIDHLRGNKMSRIDVPIDDHQELMARDDHASTEGTHDMTKLLGRLPRKTRQAIEAVKLEGKSVTETAARYGMSESNVKISIHRGLKALASFIGRCRRRIIEKPRRWAFLQLPDSSFSPRRD